MQLLPLNNRSRARNTNQNLVGRIDPKFQRDRGVLEVRKVFWEPTVKVTKARKKQLDKALARLANLIGAVRVEVTL